MSTPLAIINPQSGSGRTAKRLDELVSVIKSALGDVEVALTERAGHATEIARSAAEKGRETVIAVGGDGSIHEVVNGLMEARKNGANQTTLGIIGQGTGGDFRKSIGLEHRLDRYLAAIASGVTRAIDIGQFDYLDNQDQAKTSYFVNILSAGVGGLVDRYVHDTSGFLGGKAAYYVASLRGVLESQMGHLRVTVELDGKSETVELSTRQISICNGRFFGSGMHIAPMAIPDDGIFDVVDLGPTSKLGFMTFSGKIYDGTHITHKNVTHLRGNRVKIELLNEGVRDRFLLDVDGEPLGKLNLDVSVVPGALKMLVPA